MVNLDIIKTYKSLLEKKAQLEPYGYGHKETDDQWESVCSQLETIRIDAMDDPELLSELDRIASLFW